MISFELSILNSNDIIFYPNPFRDVVYSNVNLEDYEIEVLDIIGRKIPFHVNNKRILIGSLMTQSVIKIYKTNNYIKVIVR